MWYAAMVTVGKEEITASRCRTRMSRLDPHGDLLNKCFIPFYERQRKYCGEWHLERKILFPGYIFFASNKGNDLFEMLGDVEGMSCHKAAGREAVPLSTEEVQMLERLGGEEQIIRMSVGRIENQKLIVMSGPLTGLEDCVRKIDRHKRIAAVEFRMNGQEHRSHVGLEVVSKS